MDHPTDTRQPQDSALLRLRAKVRDMQEVDDWEVVLHTVVDELKQVGILFTWTSVLFTDLDAGTMHGYGCNYSMGTFYRVTKRPLRSALRDVVTSGQAAYRPDLWTDDPYSERGDNPQLKLRSVVDVPFASGTIALSHTLPHAFSEADIDFLHSIADILSDGAQRMEDLRNLEQRNLELEKEIAERRQVEQQLRESEERFKEFFQHASTGMAIVAVDGGLLQVNAAFCSLLGYTEEELLSREIEKFLYPDDLETHRASALRLLDGEVDSFQLEERYITGNRGAVWGLLSASIVRAKTGEPLYFIDQVNDITVRKRLERELVHLERLRAQREIAAGICHNLNNILSGVQLPAQALQLFSRDPYVQNQAKLIDTSGQRAAELVERLRQAMRAQVGDDSLEPVSLPQVIEPVIQVLRPRWQKGLESADATIGVTTHLQEVPPIRGTADDMRDIFVQLLTNAVEAMPQGGAIEIRARTHEDSVELTVSDTGIGMDEEARRRVFEPFFTTKAEVGAGLSLSIVYSTVTKWNGRIDVESAPGKGTTFVLTLPVWTAGDAIPACPTTPSPIS